MKRAGGIEESLGLDRQGEASCHPAYLLAGLVLVGLRKVLGAFVTFCGNELNHLVERSLGNGVGTLGIQNFQRHRNVTVPSGEFEEIMGTQHPCLVREEGQLLEPVLILAVVLVTGKVESLDVTDEGIGGPDSGIEAPGIVNGVYRRPGAVIEILDFS